MINTEKLIDLHLELACISGQLITLQAKHAEEMRKLRNDLSKALNTLALVLHEQDKETPCTQEET